MVRIDADIGQAAGRLSKLCFDGLIVDFWAQSELCKTVDVGKKLFIA